MIAKIKEINSNPEFSTSYPIEQAMTPSNQAPPTSQSQQRSRGQETIALHHLVTTAQLGNGIAQNFCNEAGICI